MAKILHKFIKRFFAQLRFISIKIVFIVLVILGVIYAMIWFYIANETTQKMISYIDMMRYNKIDIAIDNYNSIGFPDYFATLIEMPTYRNATRSFGWKTDAVTAYPPLLGATSLMIDASEDHFISVRSDTLENAVQKIAIRNNMCKVNIQFDEKKLNVITIKALDGLVQLFDKKQTLPMTVRTWK